MSAYKDAPPFIRAVAEKREADIIGRLQAEYVGGTLTADQARLGIAQIAELRAFVGALTTQQRLNGERLREVLINA